MLEMLRRFIALVSRLAPAWARREFRAEWEAELETARRHPRTSWRDDASLAVRAIGSVPDAWFLFRQQWGFDMLRQDVRQAIRLMRQRPGFTAAVMLTLGLGVGVNAAMFAIVNAVLLRPLPYREPSQLMAIWENDRLNAKPRYPVAPANFTEWKDEARAFEGMAAWLNQSATFKTGENTVRVPLAVVTHDLFDLLGARPAIGEEFTAEHAVPGRHRVLVLSHAAWQRYFGGDPGVVGRDIDIGGGAPYRVLGVMPRGFGYPAPETAVWRVMAFAPETMALRAVHFLSVVGRVRPGFTAAQAQADLDAIAARQARTHPGTNDQRGVTLVPLRDQIVGDVRAPLWVVAAAVFLVLLIGCANVANLMLVRAASRRRELAVRAALGADRFRLVRQLVVEGLVLAGAGGALGLALAVWLTRVLARVAAPYIPRIADAGVDAATLIVMAAVSVGAGIFFSIAPAVSASRTDVRDALQDGARQAGAGRAARRFRSAIVIGEIAVACTLVIGAGLVLRSFRQLMDVSPGFRPAGVLTADIELPETRYPDAAHINTFYDQLRTRIAAIGGVESVGFTNALPMSGGGPTTWLTIEHRPRPAGEPPEVNYRVASDDFFRAMGVPVVAGRAFSGADTPTSLLTVIVNRTLADRFFPGASPLGTRIRIGPNPKSPWRTIVGVVGDMHQMGPDVPPSPELYMPLVQDTFSDLSVVVRTAGDPLAIAGSLRAVVASLDPQLPVIEMQTLDAKVGERVASRRLLMVLLGGFAALALGLASIGIYGVMAYAVAQRTREIGVRMALGARRGDILRRVLGDGGRLAVAGLGLGIAVSLVATRALRGVLFGVTPTDPATYVAVAAGMLAVAILACYLPARRAAGVDPLSAIRAE